MEDYGKSHNHDVFPKDTSIPINKHNYYSLIWKHAIIEPLAHDDVGLYSYSGTLLVWRLRLSGIMLSSKKTQLAGVDGQWSAQ